MFMFSYYSQGWATETRKLDPERFAILNCMLCSSSGPSRGPWYRTWATGAEFSVVVTPLWSLWWGTLSLPVLRPSEWLQGHWLFQEDVRVWSLSSPSWGCFLVPAQIYTQWPLLFTKSWGTAFFRPQNILLIFLPEQQVPIQHGFALLIKGHSWIFPEQKADIS